MKITGLTVHVLKSPLAEPFAFSQGWVKQRSATLVEVHTDQGIVGWGEAFAQGLEPPEIAAACLRSTAFSSVRSRSFIGGSTRAVANGRAPCTSAADSHRPGYRRRTRAAHTSARRKRAAARTRHGHADELRLDKSRGTVEPLRWGLP